MSKLSSSANSHTAIASNGNEADYQQYCREVRRQIDECLRLLQRIEQSSDDAEYIRKLVVGHCRRYSISERTFWYYLAHYMEQRSFNLDDRPQTPFKACDAFLRQKILLLIPRISHRACAEYKKLLCFTSSVLDRMTYLFDWLLSSFLEAALTQDSWSIGDDETLLDEELFCLCERIIINAIAVMERSSGNKSSEEDF